MARNKSLPERFPDADTVIRLKMWRLNYETIVEFEGPYDQIVGDLIMMAASVGMGKDLEPKHRRALERCCKALKPEPN